MPALQETYRMEKGKGLEIIALNVTYQDSHRAAAEFVEQFGLTFPVALDHTGEVGRQYQLRALPTTFFIDPEGIIRKVVIGGPIHEATLRSSIQGLLPEGN
jgi:peroxiredoxin